MASETMYVSGKCKWSFVTRLDKYGSYSIVLYPDKESLEKIRTLTDERPAIMNRLQKDEDGYKIKFKCAPQTTYGTTVRTRSVSVYGADGKTPLVGLIGNGSDVTLQLEVYNFKQREGRAARLVAVRVNNLIEFNPEKDLQTDEQNEELEKQPVPVWG